MAKPLVVPRNEPVTHAKTWIMTRLWQTLMDNLVANVSASAVIEGSDSLTAQSATIPATAITAPIVGGLYRVSYQLRVTQAATVSSSATVTVTWVSGGNTFSQSFAAVTGNSLTTQQSGSLPCIDVDAETEIEYAVTYVSVGATPMQFALDVILELLPS